MKVYIIGSLRNTKIPEIATAIRDEGFDAFDDWFSPGPEADEYWQKFEQARGNSYEEALSKPAATHIFEFDKKHIDEADIGVLVLPAGKSAHLELGYMAGKGKLTYVLFEGEPERWDVMYQFATDVFFNLSDLIWELVRKLK